MNTPLLRVAIAALLSLALLPVTACKRAGSSASSQAPVAERLALATALGREIHRRDMVGWWASDVALAQLQPGDAERMRGWLLDADDPGAVHFVVEHDGQLGTQLRVRCDGDGPAGCQVERLSPPAPLSELNLAQLRAVATAGNHREFEPTSDRYNHVVLPADDARWWVYLIAATTDPNLLMLGRHYRFLVSADGAKVLEWRAFSKAAMVIDRTDPRLPEGASIAAHMVSHLLDDIPTEMHVWAAINYRTPIGVMTESGAMWMVVESGEIFQVESP